MKKKIIRIGSKRKTKLTKKERLLTGDIQTKVELIQALIPLGLMAVSEQLEEEVQELRTNGDVPLSQKKQINPRLATWVPPGQPCPQPPCSIGFAIGIQWLAMS